MAESFKILGQQNPAATTLTDLYTVPASTQAVVSSIVVCNRGAATSYRLSVALNGAADSNEQYIAYDRAIGLNEVHTFVLGIGLGDTDKLRCYATLATLSFSAFGVEIV